MLIELPLRALTRVALTLLMLAPACGGDDSSSGEAPIECAQMSDRICKCRREGSLYPGTPVSECSSISMPNTAICCSSGSGDYFDCTCLEINCAQDQAGCRCSTMIKQNTMDGCQGAICCLSAKDPASGGCRCGTDACPADWVQVASCGAHALQCDIGTRVQDCKAGGDFPD